MRIVIGLLAIILMGISSVSALAAEKERPRCENCGMYTDISATNVFATLKVGDAEKKHNFVCLGCIVEFNEREYEGKAELTALRVMDYATFGTKSQQLIDGTKAWYLFDTTALKGSMEPWIAAFATKDAALQAQKKLGGTLLEFKAMWAKLTAGDSEDGAPQANSAGDDETAYICQCTGGCCDDVRSAEPGKCPKCGMDLVLPGEKK